MLVGAIVDGPRSDAVLNQGLVWLPDGSTTERYTKRHPVPFGEYVPFRSQLAGLQIGRLAMIPRGMIPGTRTQPLDVADAQVVDLICFDVALTTPLPRKSGTAARWVTVQTSNGHLHRDRAAPTAVHDQSGAGHGDRTDGGGRVDQWHQRRNRPRRHRSLPIGTADDRRHRGAGGARRGTHSRGSRRRADPTRAVPDGRRRCGNRSCRCGPSEKDGATFPQYDADAWTSVGARRWSPVAGSGLGVNDGYHRPNAPPSMRITRPSTMRTSGNRTCSHRSSTSAIGLRVATYFAATTRTRTKARNTMQ